jgi:hypothetical protein
MSEKWWEPLYVASEGEFTAEVTSPNSAGHHGIVFTMGKEVEHFLWQSEVVDLVTALSRALTVFEGLFPSDAGEAHEN